MKITIPKYVGKTATRIFRATVIPIIIYSIYILYLIIGMNNGTIEITTSEFYEIISSEVVSVVLALAGTLLIDLEEKSSELKN
ncbi:MAG: hypothetical protein IJR55_07075 [Clostridia bacterium]|nr:hypothetical protein [Clostridia bacterium]